MILKEMYHFFLVDLEQVLDALSDELAGEAFVQAKKHFLQGYESEKALEPPEWMVNLRSRLQYKAKYLEELLKDGEEK